MSIKKETPIIPPIGTHNSKVVIRVFVYKRIHGMNID